MEVLTSPEFCDLTVEQIVLQLADRGEYIASESTLRRILKHEKCDAHRVPSRPRKSRPRPKRQATAPNQLWAWDITYLPTPVRGRYCYLYLILDIFSRCIVGWSVETSEDSELAQTLFERCIVEHGVAGTGLTLHSDNGAVMRSSLLHSTLERLGVHRSFSRPRVSNDNAFAESCFKTLKYRPDYPRARPREQSGWTAWVEHFVDWYNHVHRHRGIGLVTPHERHTGRDVEVHAKRNQVYEAARKANPRRWTRGIRTWRRPTVVGLTPEHETNEHETRQLP